MPLCLLLPGRERPDLKISAETLRRLPSPQQASPFSRREMHASGLVCCNLSVYVSFAHGSCRVCKGPLEPPIIQMRKLQKAEPQRRETPACGDI